MRAQKGKVILRRQRLLYIIIGSTYLATVFFLATFGEARADMSIVPAVITPARPSA